MNEAQASKALNLLERIADKLDTFEPPEPAIKPPPPKGTCVLCDLPVKHDQAHLPSPNSVGIRHASSVDCVALQ